MAGSTTSRVFVGGLEDMLETAENCVTTTVKAMLVMTTSTAGDQGSGGTDEKTIQGIISNGTLGEVTGTDWAGGHASDDRVTVAITTGDVTVETGNITQVDSDTQMEFVAVPANATNDVRGVLLYVHNTGDSDDVPIAYLAFGVGNDVTPNGGNIVVDFHANGIYRATQSA